MSQATFDPTTPGGPSDDSNSTGATGANETRETRGQSARRRPSRRGHAASAKATADTTTAQPTATPEPAQPAPAPIAAAPAEPAAAAEESGARPEGRARRTRGGAKRPARGKGAQLIIAKTNDETSPEVATSAPAAEQLAATQAPEPTAEPVVVPVVSAESATPVEAPVTPRKTRFGLPRRLQQPGAVPSTVSASRAADIAGVAEAPSATTAEPAATTESAQPTAAEPAAAATTGAPAPRYRFDRSRRTTIPGIPGARPERLSSQPSSLYTKPSQEEAPAEPTAPAASREEANGLFELPPLESLVSREAGAELPTLSFEEPTPSGAEEAERLGEGVEGVEGEAEATGASSRRRRRRRRTTAHNGAHGVEAEETTEEGAEEGMAPSAPEEALEEIYGEEPPVETAEPLYPEQGARPSYGEPAVQRGRGGRLGYPSRASRRAPAEPSWDTTAQQPAEVSPYSGPEPSYARGFGPTPSGVAMPVRESYPRPSRIDRNVDPMAAAVTQLGAVMREAINTQTDRLLTELRHQQPPAVTLTIPNAMTAERVGIFVDVANVVYSMRGLRTSVDFGRLLDFLRANRRLARAQAYAPTNPEPGADQAFLNAVKGMGYRITTKNYKTFSNGAKKADLDLDLCMDIVRLVEAKAVDTIVLVSGDSDFLPLLDYCYDHGVRVEVAAFDDAASMILRQSCDLFVNLSLVDTIRG